MEKAERSLLLEDTLEVIKQPTAGGLKQVDGPTLATAPLPSGCQHSWKHQLPCHAMPCHRVLPRDNNSGSLSHRPWWRRCTDVAPNNLGRNNRFTVGKNGQTKVIKIHYSIDSAQHNYKSQGRTLANEDTAICDTIHHVLLGLPLGN